MTAAPNQETIHASCVTIDGRALLIRGPSGSGKSDLALRLLDRGAGLISDDYTVVQRRHDRLIASAPGTIAGKIEVRGIGIVEWPHIIEAPIALSISLGAAIERMPATPLPLYTLLGIGLPEVLLDALDPSAPIKAELALREFIDAPREKDQGC